jgi:hypothetical protein
VQLRSSHLAVRRMAAGFGYWADSPSTSAVTRHESLRRTSIEKTQIAPVLHVRSFAEGPDMKLWQRRVMISQSRHVQLR